MQLFFTTHNTDILEANVRFLNRQQGIRDVICIPQVKNLEDELKRACAIRTIGGADKERDDNGLQEGFDPPFR